MSSLSPKKPIFEYVKYLGLSSLTFLKPIHISYRHGIQKFENWSDLATDARVVPTLSPQKPIFDFGNSLVLSGS